MKFLVFIFAYFCVFLEARAESRVAVSVDWPVCDPRYVTWHSHPLTCSKYVLCYHGNSVEMPCAPGLHFNRVLEQCMLPQLAKCDINYACPDIDDVLNPVFLPNPDDCSAYFVCFRGSPLPRKCAETLWFDIEFSWCTVSDEVTCDARTPNDPNRPMTTSTPGLITTTTSE
jgi:Chitin binding Peritrophin-A domain